MADNSCNSIVDSLLKGMDTIISNKTVVGEPTIMGDVIILPLVDITFGVGAGSSVNEKGNNGGGGGLGGKLTPNAVLIIKDGNAKLINIKNQDTLTKIFDMVPDMVDKIANMFDKNSSDMPTAKEAREIAFPEDME